MNNRLEAHLCSLRYRWQNKFGKYDGQLLFERNSQKCSDIIYDVLSKDNPCMIARFGNNEFRCMMNYLGIKAGPWKFWDFLSGKQYPFWWMKDVVHLMKEGAGFFSNDYENLKRFAQLQLCDIKQLDVLGCWIHDEFLIEERLNNAQKVFLLFLEPYTASNPWTRVLKGKKVLVVHPFAKLIESQYKEKRRLLFADPNVLPEFELMTIPAVQSIGGMSNGFDNWFDALHYMEKEIDSIDYDFCIIGCGAYGFPLAAHVKRSGKKAIHLGGATQLLFGIKGNRWEDPDYGSDALPKGFYVNLFNEYWVRPGDELRPRGAQQVENACYW